MHHKRAPLADPAFYSDPPAMGFGNGTGQGQAQAKTTYVRVILNAEEAVEDVR